VELRDHEDIKADYRNLVLHKCFTYCGKPLSRCKTLCRRFCQVHILSKDVWVHKNTLLSIPFTSSVTSLSHTKTRPDSTPLGWWILNTQVHIQSHSHFTNHLLATTRSMKKGVTSQSRCDMSSHEAMIRCPCVYLQTGMS
jgi:hypothetical protein